MEFVEYKAKCKFDSKDRTKYTNSKSNSLHLELLECDIQGDFSGLVGLNVEKLVINYVRRIDLSPVQEIQGLREIVLVGQPKNQIHFERFNSLEIVSSSAWPYSNSVFLNPTVRHIDAWKFGLKQFPDSRAANRLKSMTIRGFLGEDLNCESDNYGIEFLNLMLATNLKTLDGIESFRNLRRLRIDCANKLEDISAVNRVSTLKTIYLCDCRSIRTLSPLTNNKSIESFAIDGNSNVLDGNLEPLETLTNAKVIYVRPRSNYNIEVDIRPNGEFIDALPIEEWSLKPLK